MAPFALKNKEALMTIVQKYEDPSYDLESKRDLIKTIFFKGCSNEEVEIFLHVCKKTGLDPMMKQIYPVKRWSAAERKEVMTCQTSIDGFRLIAERTGRYTPGREATYTYDKDGKLISATSYVKKMTADGTWHEVAATAFFDEYAQRKKEGGLTSFWEKMPHVMLAKCAEGLALRKAFPADLSGIYTNDEMAQATQVKEVIPEESAYISNDQVVEIETKLQGRDELRQKLYHWAEIQDIHALPTSKYASCMKAIDNHISKEG